ncbi:hypothetical protein ACLOJK_015133 [Asimina triloba]
MLSPLSSFLWSLLDPCNLPVAVVPLREIIEGSLLAVGRWIVDGRDEDGSWPTTDQTVVKMLPSMMGFWGSHGCPSSSLRSALLIAGHRLLPGSAAMEEVGSPPSTGSHRELPQPVVAVRASTLLQPFVDLGEDRLSGQPWLPLIAAPPGHSSTAVGCPHPSPATVRFWGRKMMEHRILVLRWCTVHPFSECPHGLNELYYYHIHIT